ncbi:HIT domain-containing protein [Halothiobacillus sp. DCM-1]|uniref:HIT domain-containing protein n=1 Tax=Halothiobacillus sp. DCM-1 TaxID=3112558 RepID=UPI003243C116
MTTATAPWTLHPTLLKDSIPIIDLPVCSVRLLDDCRFPWVILIPRHPNLSQWTDIPLTLQHDLLDEIARVNAALQTRYLPDRLNHGVIGNLVPQLHIHCVVRYIHDEAWPGVVWGFGTRRPYSALKRLAEAHALAALLRQPSAAHS